MTWEAVGNVSGWAVTALFVVSILRGWLIPRRTYVDQLALRDKNTETEKRIAGEWKAAFEAEKKIGAELLAQHGELLEGARTTRQIVAAIPRAVNPDER